MSRVRGNLRRPAGVVPLRYGSVLTVRGAPLRTRRHGEPLPVACVGPGAAGATPLRNADRDGPPWERDGASLGSFWNTTKGVLFAPTALFSRMRCRGGYGPPLVFAVVGGMLGGLLGIVNFIPMFFVMGDGNGTPLGIGLLVGIVQQVVGGAIAAVIQAFVWGGIIHVMLLMFNSANRDFEATVRTVAYVHGSFWPLNVIPLLGGLVGGVWAIAVQIIGIARTHEISTGKASAAVLLPVFVCGGGLAAVFITAGLAAVWGSGGFNMP